MVPFDEDLSKATTKGTDVDRYVGSRIRERRVMLGLSQQQMAQLIGVTYQQAHKYERGINRISAGRLFEIARIDLIDLGFATVLSGAKDPYQVCLALGNKKVAVRSRADKAGIFQARCKFLDLEAGLDHRHCTRRSRD